MHNPRFLFWGSRAPGSLLRTGLRPGRRGLLGVLVVEGQLLPRLDGTLSIEPDAVSAINNFYARVTVPIVTVAMVDELCDVSHAGGVDHALLV